MHTVEMRKTVVELDPGSLTVTYVGKKRKYIVCREKEFKYLRIPRLQNFIAKSKIY